MCTLAERVVQQFYLLHTGGVRGLPSDGGSSSRTYRQRNGIARFGGDEALYRRAVHEEVLQRRIAERRYGELHGIGQFRTVTGGHKDSSLTGSGSSLRDAHGSRTVLRRSVNHRRSGRTVRQRVLIVHQVCVETADRLTVHRYLCQTGIAAGGGDGKG